MGATKVYPEKSEFKKESWRPRPDSLIFSISILLVARSN